MEFSTQVTSAYQQINTPALAIGVFSGGELSAAADIVNRASDGAVKSVIGMDFLGATWRSLGLAQPNWRAC
jgi:leucyl aminopeptidase